MFQFQVDGRGFGSPLRTLWQDAAQDAVNAGYARWRDNTHMEVRLDSGQGGAIAKVDLRQAVAVHEIATAAATGPKDRHGHPIRNLAISAGVATIAIATGDLFGTPPAAWLQITAFFAIWGFFAVFLSSQE